MFDLVNMLNNNEISSKIGKEVLNELLINGGNVIDIINSKGLKQISSEDELLKIIKEIISNNPSSVNDYKNGLDRSIKYLMGQIMKETKGQANPVIANKLLIDELNKN